MVTLYQIKDSLESIEPCDGDASTKYIDDAIESLKMASEALNTISVRGRSDVDKLLGCMMGIDMIIGKEYGNG
jgi:gamma-glutamyl phosphate reductase